MFLCELKRAASRLSFKIVILIGTIFSALSIIQTGRAGNTSIQEYIHSFWTSPFDNFIFFNLNPVSNILILIFPLLCAIPYSDSYLEDISSGFLKAIYTREKKQNYLIAKFFADFISSGIAFAAPLMFNLIALVMLYPSLSPHPILGRTTILEGGLLPQVYYAHPVFYILMWIFIYFLYSGATASIGLTLGVFIKNKFITLVSPFLIWWLVEGILEFCNLGKYSPLQFLYLSNSQDLVVIILEFIILLVATFIPFFLGGYVNETY